MSDQIANAGGSEPAKPGSLERVVQPQASEEEYPLCYEDDDRYCETCGNLGVIICHCGGDLCVCEYNGEIPRPDCG